MDGKWIADLLRAIIDEAGSVGAILVVLVILFFMAARSGLFPKIPRRTFSILAVLTLILLFGVIVLVIVWPTIERRILGVQTVDVILKTDNNSIVPVDFVLRYRLKDRGVLDTQGSRGVAEVRGVPLSEKNLSVVDVEVGGWSMQDRGPIQIIDGEVNVMMVKKGAAPPPDDANRPDPNAFSPTRDELLHKPDVEPDQVTLHYMNLTGKPLDLVLYPYSSEAQDNPWKLRSKWLDFPMEGESHFYDKFERGNGWYGVWVCDRQGKYWPMKAHRLFIAKEVWLVVTNKESDRERPYQVRISKAAPNAKKNQNCDGKKRTLRWFALFV